MKQYTIIKSWRDENYHRTKEISGQYNTFEEANIDRIYLQPDYDEKLEVQGLDISG